MPRIQIGRQSLSATSKHNNNTCRPFHLVAIGVFLTILLLLVLLMDPFNNSSTFQSMVVALPSEVDTLRSYSASSSDTTIIHSNGENNNNNSKSTRSSSFSKPRKITRSTSLPFPLPIPRDMHLEKLLPILLSLIRKASSSRRNHGRLVNLGAGVRDDDDPTYYLLDDPKDTWEGLLADGAEDQGELMAKRFPSEKIQTIVAYITANTIPTLLSQHGFAEDLDLLKIDIDSFDCYVVESLLKAGVRPAVIVMEVNVKFPANVRFAFLPGFLTTKNDSSSSSEQQYPFDCEKRGHVYGCSLAYQVHDLMRPHGYEILYLDANNALYYDKQREDLPAGLKDDYTPLSMADMYDRGYWNIPNRRTTFSFNHELEIWQNYQADQTVSYLQKKSLISHGHHHVVIGDLVQDGAGPQPPLRNLCFDPDSGVLKDEC